MIDIKYINVPNICFSLDDTREGIYSEQRIKTGFDDTETWSLTDTISNFTIPRLKRFKEVSDCYPSNISFDEWNEILNKIILSFELISRNEGDRIWSSEESKQIDEGLDLFREWFMFLWW